MKWIKDQLVDWQLRKLLKKVSKESHEVNIPDSIKTIGILATSAEEYEAAKASIRSQWGLKVRIIAYFYTPKKAEVNEGINHTHFTWSGQASAYFNEFLDEPLDFILVSASKLNPYMRYLLLSKQASFKVGFFSEVNKPYLDLMVAFDPNRSLSENLNLVIQYLLKIKQAC
ncbi:MAG: DUF6913 domain-containing protein [Mongoliitalea sp.]